MAIEQVRTQALPVLAVADGATTPDPGGNGWAWSSTEACPAHWDGTAWRATQRRNKSPFLLDNATITTSRSGNAETFHLKTASGADPSAADPVRVAFANTAGGFDVLERTSALSFTFSSGSTGGAIAGLEFKACPVLLNNAGVIDLGVAVRPSGIRDNSVVSTLAEGGVGGADSPRVIYSASALTNVRCRVLGYATYTLATEGTWDTAPTEILLTRAAAVEIQARELLYEKTLTANGVFDTDEWWPGATLPNSYDSFEVETTLRTSASAIDDAASVFFNDNVTPGNYRASWGFAGDAPLGGGSSSDSAAYHIAGTAPAGYFNDAVGTILAPNKASVIKALLLKGVLRRGTTAQFSYHAVASTNSSLDSINRIRFSPDGYNWGSGTGDKFVSGSSLKLYGRKTMTVLS